MPVFPLLGYSGYWSSFVGHLSRATLSSAWRELQLATEDSFNNEATKFVELQAENDALKAAMRRFKLQAQNYAKKLKAVTPASEIFFRVSADNCPMLELPLLTRIKDFLDSLVSSELVFTAYLILEKKTLQSIVDRGAKAVHTCFHFWSE